MKLKALGAVATVAAICASGAALAASDYLLEIDGVKGESKAEQIEIHSWSWGASNSGASSATRGGVRVAAGDVNGDGRADLLTASTLAEVSNFVLTVPASSSLARQCAAGKRLPNARISKAGTGTLVLSGATVRSCAVGPRQTVSMTLTGQMRHTKTGHVTLMK